MSFSEKESGIVLKIFKDLASYYNARTLSKIVGMSHAGAYKALKSLENAGILESRRLGRAVFYRVKDDKFAKKSIELLLMAEAKSKERWLSEFNELYSLCDSVVLFGSILKSEKTAHDIDLLIILKPENNKKINQLIDFKSQLLTKKLHVIKQTRQDFISNINKQDKVLLSAVCTGIVLSGVEEYVEVIINAANRKQN